MVSTTASGWIAQKILMERPMNAVVGWKPAQWAGPGRGDQRQKVQLKARHWRCTLGVNTGSKTSSSTIWKTGQRVPLASLLVTPNWEERLQRVVVLPEGP